MRVLSTCKPLGVVLKHGSDGFVACVVITSLGAAGVRTWLPSFVFLASCESEQVIMLRREERILAAETGMEKPPGAIADEASPAAGQKCRLI
jgi:hypothetical protein